MFRLLAIILLMLSPSLYAAEAGIPAFTLTDNPEGGKDYTISLQVLGIMTMLSFIPALVIMMTSFTRIVIVLGILRQAIGLQSAPSNQVIVGISLFLSFFIMSPVFNEINDTALQPYIAEEMTFKQALDKGHLPLKAFMLQQTRVKDIATFVEIAGYEGLDGPESVPMTILIPAFITSELKTAFQMGFMIFIPFLILDLVVASVLMAMGMMMLSPMMVSLPFKLMLFVLVDGWSLVMGTLATSFGVAT